MISQSFELINPFCNGNDMSTAGTIHFILHLSNVTLKLFGDKYYSNDENIVFASSFDNIISTLLLVYQSKNIPRTKFHYVFFVLKLIIIKICSTVNKMKQKVMIISSILLSVL